MKANEKSAIALAALLVGAGAGTVMASACGSKNGGTSGFDAGADGVDGGGIAPGDDDSSTPASDSGPGLNFQDAQLSPEGGGSSTPIPTTCAESLQRNSYVGCDYWPTVTLNPVWTSFDFAVAVSNPQSTAVTVTVTGGALTATKMVTVPPNSVQAIPLPWVPELKGPQFDLSTAVGDPGKSRVVTKGAYHLTTDLPVSVYQFSALEYEIDAGANAAQCPGFSATANPHCFSFSNDASLLLPSNVATGNYGVLAWPAFAATPGFVAVTATRDGTKVKVFPAGRTQGVPGNGPALMVRGDEATYALNAGDVLELFSDTGDVHQAKYASDVSGTIIEADQPVLTWGGHGCTFIPEGKKACDHLESTMFPVETLGTQYIVSMPHTPHGEHQWVRVMGLYDNTLLTFDPPTSGMTNATLNTGDVLELPDVASSFALVANGRVLVAQYMMGEYATVAADAASPSPDEGDPSESPAIPISQYRSSYTFLAPGTYTENWIDVMAPTGATITLDGAPIPASDFHQLGSQTAYVVASHKLASGGDGHEIHGDAPFGLVVYGYGSRTSYMYPGGLDLRQVIVPPPPPPPPPK